MGSLQKSPGWRGMFVSCQEYRKYCCTDIQVLYSTYVRLKNMTLLLCSRMKNKPIPSFPSVDTQNISISLRAPWVLNLCPLCIAISVVLQEQHIVLTFAPQERKCHVITFQEIHAMLLMRHDTEHDLHFHFTEPSLHFTRIKLS